MSFLADALHDCKVILLIARWLMASAVAKTHVALRTNPGLCTKAAGLPICWMTIADSCPCPCRWFGSTFLSIILLACRQHFGEWLVAAHRHVLYKLAFVGLYLELSTTGDYFVELLRLSVPVNICHLDRFEICSVLWCGFKSCACECR